MREEGTSAPGQPSAWPGAVPSEKTATNSAPNQGEGRHIGAESHGKEFTQNSDKQVSKKH